MTHSIFRHIRPSLAVILIAALALFATPPALVQAAHFNCHVEWRS